MKRILMVLFAAAAGMVLLAQLNFEQAMEKASLVDSDAEIQAVLHAHGFDCDIYDQITPGDKIEAFFNIINK